jgi:DNA-binding response OmpR family regulator
VVTLRGGTADGGRDADVKILVVDDDHDLLALVGFALTQAGFVVVKAADVASALRAFAHESPDLAILDINLPGGSGFDICQAIRRQSRIPIMMLTARGEEEDLVRALDLGADDYLTKPFDLRELQARVRALARRSGPDRGGVIEFGRLAVDPAGRVASCEGAQLSLTRREFSLLEALMANRARVMPKERLFDRIFSMDDEEIGLNAIETYVARLRRKLEGSGVAIRTLRGLGYQLVRVD